AVRSPAFRRPPRNMCDRLKAEPQTSIMKFAIVGAGAIGAFLGAMLTRAGEDVTLIARGAHLRAMQKHGVRVRGEIGDFQVAVKATDEPKAVGEVDFLVLTLKAHS